MARELERITYVEDEPDIREVAIIALQSLGGFEIDVCVSGGEAVDKVPSFAPDLILLDVMMPGMDGIETFKRLRANRDLADVPIVFMTANTQPNDLARYTELGCAGIIAKPFDPVALSGQIRSIWERIH